MRMIISVKLFMLIIISIKKLHLVIITVKHFYAHNYFSNNFSHYSTCRSAESHIVSVSIFRALMLSAYVSNVIILSVMAPINSLKT